MPDVLHWLGITQDPPLRLDEQHEVRRDRARGHRVGERVPIPDELIPPDARVEMDAKMAAGYFTERRRPRRRPSSTSPRAASRRERASPAGRRRGRLPAHARGHPRALRAHAGSRARRRAAITSRSTSTRLTPRRRSRGVGHARALSRPRASRCTAAGATSTPAACDRAAELERGARRGARADERARARIDLVVVERAARRRRRAGAGATARRRPASDYGRSEGLAVASFHLFARGGFSADPRRPVARRRRRRSRR